MDVSAESKIQGKLSKSLDPNEGLGLEIRLRQLGKLVADIANTDLLPTTEELNGTVAQEDGESVVERFLIRICPVFEEEISEKLAGLGRWRSGNLARISHLASMKLLVELSQMHLGVHPRVMAAVIDKASLTEDPTLIEMWANYLVAACTFEQDDERYASYAHILENITPGQARLLNRLARTTKTCDILGTLDNQSFTSLALQELAEISEADELSELRLDLTHLEALRLLDVAWKANTRQAVIRVTSLGMQLFKITCSD